MQSKLKTAEVARAHLKVEHCNSFISRNYWLWVAVSWLIYPLAALFSAITEGGRIYMSAQDVVPSPALAMLATFLLVILIEGVSFFTGKTAVDDLQAGVFSLGGAHTSAFAVKIIVFLMCTGFSVSLSLSGAHDGSIHMAKQSQPPTLLSGDSLNAQYDKRLAPYLSTMDAAQNTKWKGSVTREAMRTLDKTQETAAALERDRAAALVALNAENERIKAEWETNAVASAGWLQKFAGIGEILKIFALIFIGIYDQGVMKEAKAQVAAPASPIAPASTAPAASPLAASTGPTASSPIATFSAPSAPISYGSPHPSSLIARLSGATAAHPLSPPPSSSGTTSSAGVPPVATSSNPVATEDDDDDEDIDVRALKRARANAVAIWKSWRAKTPKSKKAEQTQQRNMAERQAEIAQYDARLNERYGITMENYTEA